MATITGTDSADVILDTAESDLLIGLSGNDSITSSVGIDTVYGGLGNDVLTSTNGAWNFASVYGGAGSDTVYASGLGMIGYGGDGNDLLQILSSLATPEFHGGNGNDTLNCIAVGPQPSDVIFGYGGDGNDVIYGSLNTQFLGDAGDDLIFGGNVYGGSGNDTLTGGSYANGGGGNDVLKLTEAGYADGGEGRDVINGSQFADTLYHSNGNAKIFGNGGADTIGSLHGVNTIHGGAGDDEISDSGSRSRVFGDEGNDTVIEMYGHASLFGGSGNDKVYFSDVTKGSTLYGGAGDDSLFGYSASDFDSSKPVQNSVWKGGWGNDIISGTDGADTIYGGRGIDTLDGGSDGAVGLDRANTFVFLTAAEMGNVHSGDVIGGFRTGIDKIDLSSIGGLTFIGSATFHHASGEVRYDIGLSQLWVDLDGNGRLDGFLHVEPVAAGDLIL